MIMAKMDELFNDMYNYCEENGCWGAWMTAGDWNNCLQKKYGSASFTALVNAGRLEKSKDYKATSYSYHLVPVRAIKEKIEEEEKERQRKNAEWAIKSHDENIARIKANYEEMIKEAEDYLKRNLEWEAEDLEKSKAVLENANNNTELNK